MSNKVNDSVKKQMAEDDDEYELETEDLEKAHPREDATRKRRDEVKLRLDTGKERVRFRRKWYQLWSVLLNLYRDASLDLVQDAQESPTSPACFAIRCSCE